MEDLRTGCFIGIFLLFIFWTISFGDRDPIVNNASNPFSTPSNQRAPASEQENFALPQLDSYALKTRAHDWSVEHLAGDRVLLTHKTHKKYILIVQYRSALSVDNASRYLTADFVRDAKETRLGALSLDRSPIRNLNAEVTEIQARKVGRVSFDVSFDDANAFFDERIWAEPGLIWQISTVSLGIGPSPSFEGDMDAVMESLIRSKARKSSWLDVVLPKAEAAELGRTQVPSPRSVPPFTGFHVPTNAECAKENIPAFKRGPPGLKFSASSLSQFRKECSAGAVKGFDVVVNALKKSFIRGLQDAEKHTETNMKKLGCQNQAPTPLPKHPSFWDLLAQSQMNEVESNCLQSAGTMALVQTGGDMASQTVRGIGALVNWVRTTKDPILVISAIIQSKVGGFMCLNADAQMAAYCEFVSAAATAAAGVFATGAATGGAVAGLSGETALAEIGAAATRAGLKAVLDTLKSPYTIPRDMVKLTVAAPGAALATGKVAVQLARNLASAHSAAKAIDVGHLVEVGMVAAGDRASLGEVRDGIDNYILKTQMPAAKKEKLLHDVSDHFKRVEEIHGSYAHFLKGTPTENAKIIRLVSEAEKNGVPRQKVFETLKRAQKQNRCEVPR